MLSLLETMERKLQAAVGELETAELSSALCTQSTTLASRVAAALEERTRILDERDKVWDKLWTKRTRQIAERNEELDGRMEAFRKQECAFKRKNEQLLLLNSELEKENSDLRARLAGYETEMEKRDAVEIQQYSIADPDEVEFLSPTNSSRSSGPEADADTPAQPRRRVRFADEAEVGAKDEAFGTDAPAERDGFYDWLMVDNYLDRKAQ
jgi:hypothetical protein